MSDLTYKDLRDNEEFQTLQTEALFAAELLKDNPDMTRTEALKIVKRKVEVEND